MTERWRKKLEGIDQVAPRDDVYERAKAGPRLPEAQSPIQRTSTTVATAIAAFVVFALAISLFVVPTLRLRDDSSALSAGGQLLPLWPARTVEQVQALQDEADAGQAGWALDPRQVGTRFGQAVLGWPDAWAGGVSSIAPTCGVLQGTYPNTASRRSHAPTREAQTRSWASRVPIPVPTWPVAIRRSSSAARRPAEIYRRAPPAHSSALPSLYVTPRPVMPHQRRRSSYSNR